MNLLAKLLGRAAPSPAVPTSSRRPASIAPSPATQPGLRLLAKATLAKETGYPESNEDYAARRRAHARWALCDGASESYAARLWARCVALTFVAAPSLTMPTLQGDFAAIAGRH